MLILTLLIYYRVWFLDWDWNFIAYIHDSGQIIVPNPNLAQFQLQFLKINGIGSYFWVSVSS